MKLKWQKIFLICLPFCLAFVMPSSSCSKQNNELNVTNFKVDKLSETSCNLHFEIDLLDWTSDWSKTEFKETHEMTTNTSITKETSIAKKINFNVEFADRKRLYEYTYREKITFVLTDITNLKTKTYKFYLYMEILDNQLAECKITKIV